MTSYLPGCCSQQDELPAHLCDIATLLWGLVTYLCRDSANGLYALSLAGARPSRSSCQLVRRLHPRAARDSVIHDQTPKISRRYNGHLPNLAGRASSHDLAVQPPRAQEHCGVMEWERFQGECESSEYCSRMPRIKRRNQSAVRTQLCYHRLGSMYLV
jgi:hypothetical protein